jgi:hypothetical protein
VRRLGSGSMLLMTYYYGHLKVHLFRDEAGWMTVTSDDGDQLFNPSHIPTWEGMRTELLRIGFTLE